MENHQFIVDFPLTAPFIVDFQLPCLITGGYDGNIYLVGGLEHFLFFHSVGNVIIPADELIFFRGVAQPPIRYSTVVYPLVN